MLLGVRSFKQLESLKSALKFMLENKEEVIFTQSENNYQNFRKKAGKLQQLVLEKSNKIILALTNSKKIRYVRKHIHSQNTNTIPDEIFLQVLKEQNL
jgi:hypothetical protein